MLARVGCHCDLGCDSSCPWTVQLLWTAALISPVKQEAAAAAVSHLGETQRVQADPQDSGPRSVLDLSEDPGPLLLRLIVPDEVDRNSFVVKCNVRTDKFETLE